MKLWRISIAFSFYLCAAQLFNLALAQNCEFFASGTAISTNDFGPKGISQFSTRFLMYVKNRQSLIRTSESPSVNLESPTCKDSYMEYGQLDGTNSYLLTSFGPALTNRSANCAFIQLSTSVVPITGTHLGSVWLTFMGATVYGNLGKGLVDPIFPPGAGFRECKRQLPANWEVSQQPNCSFLTAYNDVSDGYSYSIVNRVYERRDLKIRKGEIRTNSFFRTVVWTNFNGETFPREAFSQARVLAYNSQEEYTHTCWIRLEQIRMRIPENAFELILPGPTTVVDLRFHTEANFPALYSYLTTNELRSLKEVAADPGLQGDLQYAKASQPRKKRLFPYSIFFLLFVAPLIYVVMSRSKSKQ